MLGLSALGVQVHCMPVIEPTIADVLPQVYTVVSVITLIKTLVLFYTLKYIYLYFKMK